MRYAIYFAAGADDSLMQLGNAWLGRDPFAGTDLPQPVINGMTAKRMHALTSSPRRYGFHGTLKAPFQLSEGQTEAGLLEACAAFAGEIAPYDIAGLSVNRLGRFLALTPDVPEAELSAFAALCVRRFEDFRAPLGKADLERRRQGGLSPRQDTYMTRWGYPYIFDEFRFHMTLSVKLDDDSEAAALEAAAKTYFADVTGCARAANAFGLYIEPEPGAPFQVLKVFTLTGSVLPSGALGDDNSFKHEETA